MGGAKRRVSDDPKTRKRGDPTIAAVGGRKRSSEELNDGSVVSTTTGGDEFRVSSWDGDREADEESACWLTVCAALSITKERCICISVFCFLFLLSFFRSFVTRRTALFFLS